MSGAAALHVECRGAGAPVVLLHGWGLHGGIWQPLLAPLSARFRTLAVDLPGHGGSRDVRLPESADALGAFADLLVARLDRPADWVGWSLGGLVALEAARRHPAAVRRLVLVGTTPRFVQGPDWECAMSTSLLAGFAHSLESDYRGTLERFLSLQVGAQERSLLRALRAALSERPMPDPGALRAGLALLRDSDLRAVLPEVTQPALVVHGARDRLAPAAAGRYLAAHLPAAQFQLIDRAGHAPFLSHAAEFAACVEHFLHE